MSVQVRKHLVKRITASMLLVLVATIAMPGLGGAEPSRQAQGPRSVTIPAEGSVTLTVRGFCLDFGKPFPTGETQAQGLAEDKVRSALAYAISKGYTEGNAQQTQLAFWFLRGAQWQATDHAIGQEIVDNANTPPSDTADGTSIAAAITGNMLTAKATFVPQTADAYYGDGKVVLQNTTKFEMKVFMPIGVVFRATDTAGNFQDLVAYDLGVERVEVQGTAALTVVPTITLQPTTQPTITAITTPLAGTPTVAAPVATEAQAQVPTTVVAPTTETVASAPTATATRRDLPGTGAGEDALLLLLLLAGTVSLGMLAIGATLRRSGR